ncbi:MAG: hypothetical protein AAB855_01555, partial [Patescibacteria group bacterium]
MEEVKNRLGDGFKVSEVDGKMVIKGEIGGKGFLKGTSHIDQALRVYLSKEYGGDWLVDNYGKKLLSGAKIPTHALDAIENVIQNLKDPAIVEEVLGKKVDLLSWNPKLKTFELNYDEEALDALMKHGLKVATQDAGGTNTSHQLWEERLGHDVEDFKTETKAPARVAAHPEGGKKGVMTERTGVRGVGRVEPVYKEGAASDARVMSDAAFTHDEDVRSGLSAQEKAEIAAQNARLARGENIAPLRATDVATAAVPVEVVPQAVSAEASPSAPRVIGEAVSAGASESITAMATQDVGVPKIEVPAPDKITGQAVS